MHKTNASHVRSEVLGNVMSNTEPMTLNVQNHNEQNIYRKINLCYPDLGEV